MLQSKSAANNVLSSRFIQIAGGRRKIMAEQKQRLTADELKVQEEISSIVKQLNDKILYLKKTGINVSLNHKAFNDGRKDFYVGVYVTMKIDF